MSTAQILSPYAIDDFGRNVFTGAETYKGPVFHVAYPAGSDIMQESLGWVAGGYRMPVGPANSNGEGFRLIVLGDIPQWMQAGLGNHGVAFELKKQRGRPIPISAASLI